ncbi:unnamed protein product [Urochloa humidicola]
MEARRVRTRSATRAAAAAASIFSVLAIDDLLREILLRLGFPTTLVRAALVCRRWFRHASDPAFLRRFRNLHPPRLLGFYVSSSSEGQLDPASRFVPMPHQPSELAAVLRRGSFSLDPSYMSLSPRVTGCWNGNVLFRLRHPDGKVRYVVHSPLHPARAMDTVPPVPTVPRENGTMLSYDELLMSNGGDEPSYFWLSMQINYQLKATVDVYMLQDDVWRIILASATKKKHERLFLQGPVILRVGDRIYFSAILNRILVLDLASSSFSSIEVPVLGGRFDRHMLSRANDSGVYLVHVKELHLRIWFHREGSGSAGDWLLVDSIFLHDMCAKLRMSTSCTGHERPPPVIRLMDVGDYAEFVLLVMDNKSLLYLDVRRRELRKVYEETGEDPNKDYGIIPFMMAWPPVFPELKE